MTWHATMLGGPEDGRTFEGPGNVPPPELVVARQHPLTREDLERDTGSSPWPDGAVSFDRIVCRRERYSDGRWVYAWPTGTGS